MILLSKFLMWPMSVLFLQFDRIQDLLYSEGKLQTCSTCPIKQPLFTKSFSHIEVQRNPSTVANSMFLFTHYYWKQRKIEMAPRHTASPSVEAWKLSLPSNSILLAAQSERKSQRHDNPLLSSSLGAKPLVDHNHVQRPYYPLLSCSTAA